mmetsp:Transcript_34552/g.67639  ORF Transcript_34552/g.67639 Transcript_34552/m.67639 type:complete len:267 (-) Transcript_34552:218-1018(-)
MSSHELDDSYAVCHGCCLHLCHFDRSHPLLSRCLESKASVDQLDVIVNRLWDTSNHHMQPPLPRLIIQLAGGRMCAVASDDEEHVDSKLHGSVDYFFRVKPSPRRPQHSTPDIVNVLNDIWRQHHRRRLQVGESAKPIADAEHLALLDAIRCMSLHRDLSNHIVQTRTKAPTRHNAHASLLPLEGQLPPRAGSHERRFLWFRRVVEVHDGTLKHKLPICHKRLVALVWQHPALSLEPVDLPLHHTGSLEAHGSLILLKHAPSSTPL